IEEKIKPFNSLFSSFFFFSIGLLVSFSSVLSNMLLLVIFILIGFIVRFIASGASAYLIGFPGRGACFCAAAFLPISELSLLLISQGSASGLVQKDFLGSFAFAIIASSFISAWALHKENELYNLLQAVSPQIIIKNFRLMRTTVLGIRRAFSETTRYYRVVEKLPSISYNFESLSTREQMVLTAKNSILLLAFSGICFAAIFIMQVPGWDFLSDFFIFIFSAFFVSSALFQVNAQASFDSLAKMMARSNTGAKYLSIAYLSAAGFFLLLVLSFILAYQIAAASLSIILALSAAVFFFKNLLRAIKEAFPNKIKLK
ncbi:MAG: cation:proton antiporter, partial [Candidatus Anstonellaceae archaeon]